MQEKLAFAPLEPIFLADPYRSYAEHRATDPATWSDHLAAWVFFDYLTCRQVNLDSDRFKMDFRLLGDKIEETSRGVQHLDDPEHGIVRRRLTRVLTGLDRQLWVQTTLAAVADRIDALDQPGLELNDFLISPLVTTSMTAMLALPGFTDMPTFRSAQEAICRSMDAGLDPTRGPAGERGRRYVSNLLAESLATADRNSEWAALINSAADRRERWWIINSIRQIVVAGYLSSSSMLGNGLIALAKAGLLDGARPLELNHTGYNELVRFCGPVQVEARVSAEDTELHGVAVAAGQEVLLVLASANRDGTMFPQPDRLSLDRTPNHHLGFGKGIHACLGLRLASDLHIAVINQFSRRYQVDRTVDSVLRPTATLRGYDSIQFKLTRRK